MKRQPKNRWVVLVKPPDDHPAWSQIMGPWFLEEKANEFCEKVRATIDAVETDLDAAQGYAYVLRLEEPHLTVARQWALKGDQA